MMIEVRTNTSSKSSQTVMGQLWDNEYSRNGTGGGGGNCGCDPVGGCNRMTYLRIM